MISKKTCKISAVLIVLSMTLLFIMKFYNNPHSNTNEKIDYKNQDYREAYHFTVPAKWKNDPQKPIFFHGEYHYYYLYNGNYPNVSGTEWRHATSEDLVHWKDEGIAIPKYTNKNGDIWSGSLVVDSNNSAGFGKNAFIAIMTQPSAKSGAQEQYLWYSTDNGNTFKCYNERPVLSNPGVEDFRDPKIIWDSQGQKWIMLLAEGTKIGFYESHNLKNWKYTGGFFTQNIGTVECPDIFIMRANDGIYKWVLGTSANGKSLGKPNTYAYWTGEYNGKEFIADNNEPQWLDYGFDWYGAVTFDVSNSSGKFEKRYALAWMNNWDYPNNNPTIKYGFNGVDSIVRQINLKKQRGYNTYSLISQPVEYLNKNVKSIDYFKKIDVVGSKTLKIQGTAYQIDADINYLDAKNVGFRLRESSDKKRHIDVGIFTEGKYSYVNRTFTGQPDKSQKYVESKAPFDVNNKKVHLKILVDKTTIEVFLDDGKVVYSNEVFPNLNDKGITLFSVDSKSIFENIEIRHFNRIDN